MTAPGLPATPCPSCGSLYVIGMDSGLMFCPECRNEWNPREMPKHEEVAGRIDATGTKLDAALERHAGGGSYDTVVEVTHDDGGSGNVRTDRYVYHSTTPHTMQDALDMAVEHFSVAVGSHVEEAKVAERIPDVEPEPVAEEAIRQVTEGEATSVASLTPDTAPSAPLATADELAEVREQHDAEIDNADDEAVDDAPSEQDAILAAAYLETLTGTGVTLEGGQRATLLDFPDDDHARVQLSTGDVAVVDFNDIASADPQTVEAETPDVELDDETAEMFGGAALILACLVIEAGIASIEGEGAESTLIEPPSGWFPPDEDAVPLMEQAAAGAVSMLIQTFALPRAELQAMVAGVRESVTAETTTEVKGNGTNTNQE
jgi:hypothetical protein